MQTDTTRYYIELTYTTDPELVEDARAAGIGKGTDSVALFKDDGGVTVAIPCASPARDVIQVLGTADDMARNLFAGLRPDSKPEDYPSPWRMLLIDPGLMAEHYRSTNDVPPPEQPPGPDAGDGAPVTPIRPAPAIAAPKEAA